MTNEKILLITLSLLGATTAQQIHSAEFRLNQSEAKEYAATIIQQHLTVDPASLQTLFSNVQSRLTGTYSLEAVEAIVQTELMRHNAEQARKNTHQARESARQSYQWDNSPGAYCDDATAQKEYQWIDSSGAYDNTKPSQQYDNAQEQHPQAKSQSADTSQKVAQQLARSLGATITEYFDGPVLAVRLLAPHQTRGVSCGLHAIANLHSAQNFVAAYSGVTPAEADSFRTASERTYSALEQRHGIPQQQLELAQLLEYIHSSEYAIRNFYAFRFDKNVLIPAVGCAENHAYYDALYPTFNVTIRKLLEQNDEVKMLNLCLQTGIEQDSGHWIAISIVQTQQMRQPIILFSDPIGNQNPSRTSDQYKKAIGAVQRLVEVKIRAL